jgi:hypothetical protein
MTARIYPTFSRSAVLARLNQFKGKRYQNVNLAKIFGVTTMEVQTVLNELVETGQIKSEGPSDSRWYWMQKNESPIVAKPRFEGEFRPLKQETIRALYTAQERAKGR